MSKNKGKGGKGKRKGKKHADDSKRELEFKDESQEYAQVTKMLGNGRLEASCFDGQTRLCHIRGKFTKRVWINQGDIILIGLRDYQDGKGDVIHKYSLDEARTLKAYGEIPESVVIGAGGGGGDEDAGDKGDIAFGGMSSDEDEYQSHQKTNNERLVSDDEDEKQEAAKDWNKVLDEL
jgi:translation initiation factor 1A